MSFSLIGLSTVRTVAIGALLAAAAQSAAASTLRTTEVYRVNAPVLIGSTTEVVKRDGRLFEETTNHYRTETINRTTERRSRTVHDSNTRRFNYNTQARFRGTGEKWYNSNVRADGSMANGTRRLTWGNGRSGPSSYTWSPNDRNSQRAGTVFSLGRFTHQNNIIRGGITHTNLDMRLTLDLGGYNYRNFDMSFYIDHTESWNWFRDVEDAVDISDERFTRTFRVGATEYTLQLLGFHNPGGGYNQSLRVNERQHDELDLLARVTSRSERTVWDRRSWFTSTFADSHETITRELPSEVPLPAGFPLLIGGLAALGLIKRRSKA